MLDAGLAVKALIHITSDGLLNLARVAPRPLRHRSPLDTSRFSRLIQRHGAIPAPEMFRVYNMGIGFCVIVAPRDADRVVSIAAKHGRTAGVIGYTVHDPEKRVWLPDLQANRQGRQFRAEPRRAAGPPARPQPTLIPLLPLSCGRRGAAWPAQMRVPAPPPESPPRQLATQPHLRLKSAHAAQRRQHTLDLIGHTPVFRLNRIPGPHDAEIWAKLENYNPGGSVKDRICLAMVEQAERDGRLKPGDTIVEPTSGNTGIGLALVCAVKGYNLILTMPDTMSEERRSLLAAYGAKLVLTPDTRGMQGAIAQAEELVRNNPGYFMPQQFNNPANPEIHYAGTGPELIEQLDRIDAFVAGVGTGGTISGVGRYLREKLTHAAADRCGRAQQLAGALRRRGGLPSDSGNRRRFCPAKSRHQYLRRDHHGERRRRDQLYATPGPRGGILVGISSGANCCAALQVAQRLGPGKVVVAVFCDTGERYLTTDLFKAEGI